MPKRKKTEGRNSVDLATDFYSNPNANLVAFESIIKSASPPDKQKAIGRVVKRTLEAEGTSLNERTGKDIGTFPTRGSGLTYGYGIDLKHLTKKQLVAAGATNKEVDKFVSWMGKDETALIKEGKTLPDKEAFGDDELYPRPTMSTVLSDKIAIKLIQKHRKKIEPLAKNLSGTAKDVLTSLRHWTGRLGNTPEKAKKMEGQGKPVANKLLVRRFSGDFDLEGTRVNPVWDALKGGDATKDTLLAAMKSTWGMYPAGESGDWKRERMRKEMKKLAGKDVVPIIHKKKQGVKTNAR